METTYEAEQNVPAGELDDYRIMPAWCAFVLGGVTTFLLVYLGIARPTAHELDTMRRQVGALEQSIWEIAGKQDDVARTNSLLAELTAQSAQVTKARLAVNDVQSLRRQLQHEASNLQQALATVAELGAIKESLLSYSDNAQEAAAVVSASESLCNDLQHEVGNIKSAMAAVADLASIKESLLTYASETREAADVASVAELLCNRLAESAGSTYEALQVSDDLLAIRDDLLDSPHATQEAADNLNQLIGLRQQLKDHASELPAAENALHDLLTLKSMVLAQRPELLTTLETLEIIQDLSREFDQASVSFERIRHWMVEVVASESILERARQSLAPLTEIASLRHLEPNALRQMTRRLAASHTPQIASKPETSASALGEPTIEDEDLVVD